MKIMLGMGNPLRADDGIGPRIIEWILTNKEKHGPKPFHHRSDKQWHNDIDFADIGGNIWNLQSYFNQDTQSILIIDCAEMGITPGSHQFFPLQQLLKQGTQFNTNIHSLTAHQTELAVLINLYQQAGQTLPPISIMAIQPQSTAYRISLSPYLEERIGYYADLALQYIQNKSIGF